MSGENTGLCFKISLRTDVYFLVRTSDESTDKIEGSVVWYSWKNHEILVILVKRIMTFFNEPTNDANLMNSQQMYLSHHLDEIMERRFHGEGHWANQPMYKILMSLTRKRPRDLVKLCTLAGREAYRNGSNIILTKHFLNIFEDYSQGRITDTINEYKSELPNIEKLLFGMKPSKVKKDKGYSDSFVFTTAELSQKIFNIMQNNTFAFSNGRSATAKDLGHFLYKINFLTARKRVEDGEIDRKYFEENKYLASSVADFGYDWEIHPAYRWALQPDSMEDIFLKLFPSCD